MDCMRDSFVEGVLLDGRFKTVSPLNHGSFGMVFKAVDILTGDFVALKCLTKPSAAAECAHSLAVDDRSEELAIHRKIDTHANIVNLVHHFETEHHVYLVLEFCANGDLYEAIRLDRAPGQTEHVRECMLQLVDAVEHMHNRGIYHRDIKPENIFLSQEGNLKLGDFGLATMESWSYEASVGSDRYMAPEQYDHLNAGYSPPQADIWAVGICLLNVLFSRNPFATPTLDDPLFSDFANDRQTLFDVFPNMSQDTYEVLMHCLAIDPTKRSLHGAKTALERAVSFTTEDESLDDFCVFEDTDPVEITTANRQPLRTPSISTPAIDQGGAFPWAKALAMSPPPLNARQLSAIPDTESFFGDEVATTYAKGGDWFTLKPEPSSVTSFVDSGLGLSLKSNGPTVPATAAMESFKFPLFAPRSKPLLMSGSLPATMARPIPSMAAVFGGSGIGGGKRELVSKSWSEIWDEDEEEAIRGSSSDAELELEGEEVEIVGRDGDGSDTPRPTVTDLVNAADKPVEALPVSPTTVGFSSNVAQAIDDHDHEIDTESVISEQTGFLFEDLHSSGANTPLASGHSTSKTTGSPPAKAREALDRWAMLGELRRGMGTPKRSSPLPSSIASVFGTSVPVTRERDEVTSARKQPSSSSSSSRVRAKSWRRNVNWAPSPSPAQVATVATAVAGKDWTTSKDWRQHSSPCVPTMNSYHQPHQQQQHALARTFGAFGPCADARVNPSTEWVWRSDLLHL